MRLSLRDGCSVVVYFQRACEFFGLVFMQHEAAAGNCSMPKRDVAAGANRSAGHEDEIFERHRRVSHSGYFCSCFPGPVLAEIA